MKIAEMTKMFIDSRRRGTDGARKRCSPKTIAVYKRNMDILERFLLEDAPDGAVVDYENMRRGTILALVDWIMAKEKAGRWSRSTALQFWRCLKSFFRWIEQDEDCQEDGLKNFGKYLPSIEKSPRREYIPMTADLRQFRNSYDTHKPYAFRNYVAFSLMLDTGIRNSELCDLRLDDVMLEDNLIIVDGKGGRRRIIPLTEGTGRLLKAWLKRREGTVQGATSEYVFISKYGARLTANGFGQTFRKMQKAHNLPKISAHTLRHSFATYYLQGGGSLERLRLIMGHSSFEMTKEYLHMAQVNDKGARSELEKVSVLKNL